MTGKKTRKREHSRRGRKEVTEASLKGRQLGRESDHMRKSPRNSVGPEALQMRMCFWKRNTVSSRVHFKNTPINQTEDGREESKQMNSFP